MATACNASSATNDSAYLPRSVNLDGMFLPSSDLVTMNASVPIQAISRLVLLAAVISTLRAQSPSPGRVTFYSEPNFSGESFAVETGAAVSDLTQLLRQNEYPWLATAASVRVEGNATATVFDGTNYRGHRLDLGGNVADLRVIARGSDGRNTWDHCIASVTVTVQSRQAPVVVAPPMPPPPQPVAVTVQPPPPPPPPRPTYTLRSADIVIEQVYRDVLNHEPDQAGRRHYREKLMRDGWSDHELFEDLRRSPEARALNPDAVITAIYRDALGREPDENGLGHYRKLWRDGWTPGRIREDLERSGEGRDRAIRLAITRAYRETLRRDPDAQGLANYDRLMRDKGWTEEQIRASLRESAEYRNLPHDRPPK